MKTFSPRYLALTALLWGFVSCGTPDQGGARGPDTTDQDSGGGGAAGAGAAGTSGASGAGGREAGTVVPKTCQDVVCDPNATCSGTGDQAKCACVAGFTGDGVHCDDIDECEAASANDCDTNAQCTNKPGSYFCKCKDGFLGDGKTCTAVDQCSAANNICDPNAVCDNAGDGGVGCTCKPGFTGDGFGCGDVNECLSPGAFSCVANAHCVNNFGGYGCACNAGFSGDGNTACTALCDVAKADTATCAAQGVCRIEGTAAVCDACAAGFTGNGKTCQAATCPAACDGMGTDDLPHAICSSGGTCTCAPGFDGTPGSCVDKNECVTDNGGCGDNTNCTNTVGGYVCACKTGYARGANGQCVDIDECSAMPGPCHPDATCTNKTPDENPLGYECACKTGFTGDGFTCADIDECATQNGGCLANATCENHRGGFDCACTAPLVGDPSNCHCDLTGLWAMRLDVDLCWKEVPIQTGGGQDLIAAGSTEATDWELHELTYDGTTMSVRKKSCGTDNPPDIVSPLFRETYSTFIPFSVADLTPLFPGTSFTQAGLVPGSTYTSPPEALVTGIDLGADPVNATWPATHSDVDPAQWLDTEGDGVPGETLWPKTPSTLTHSGTSHYSYLPVRPDVGSGTLIIDQRTACVSAAGREITHLAANVESCTRITGKVIYDKEDTRAASCTLVPKGTCTPGNASCTGWQLDVTCTADDWQNANAIPCSSDDLDRVDDQRGSQLLSTASTFELVRMGATTDSVTCNDVRTAYPSLVHTVPTISCTPPP